MPKSSSITTTSPRASALAVDEHVDRLAGVAVELQDRALAERQQLADRQRRAAELDRDRERHLEQQADVGSRGGVGVERRAACSSSISSITGWLPSCARGRSLLEQQLLERRLVERPSASSPSSASTAVSVGRTLDGVRSTASMASRGLARRRRSLDREAREVDVERDRVGLVRDVRHDPLLELRSCRSCVASWRRGVAPRRPRSRCPGSAA